MRVTPLRRWAVLVAALAISLAACGDGDGGGTGQDGGASPGEQQGGQEVSLLHAISGKEEQAALEEAISAYEESSGNTVSVEHSPDFETVVVTRVQGGNAPDVALFPQPGLLNRIADQGNATPLEEAGVDVQSLRDELVSGMVETGTFDDTVYGTVVKLGIKSLLWYAQDDFESQGYSAPEDWQGMLDLSDQIAGDLGGESGRAPWCIGIESGGATGWVATDWIEDIMLRLHGPDVYDQWIEHEIKFNSPEVKEAFEELERIWFNDEYVLGGTTGILQTPFAEAVAPMFNDPPGCYLHRQAGFITSSFPEDAEVGTDVAMTYFPAMEDNDVGNPVLFAGDTAAILTDNQAAADFVEFLASAEGQEAWMSHEGAGSLSVRTDFDSSQYPTDVLAQQGDILSQADFARFDASDLMPGEVGAGAFWSEMVAWISGQQDLETTLNNIDNAWPESAE